MKGRCFNVLLINVLVQFPCEQNSNDDVDSDSDASYTVENEDDPDEMDISDDHIEGDTSEPIDEEQQQTGFDARFWQVTTTILLLTEEAKLLFSVLFLCMFTDNFFSHSVHQ